MIIKFAYLLGPLTGGIIGYFTNWLAIKMMFRSHKPKYIFGMKIPFTLGLIPKERGRITEAVGNSISENLMNKEVLGKNLLSENMLIKIGTEYDTFVTRQKVNNEILRDIISHFISSQGLEKILSEACGELASQIHSRLAGFQSR